MHYPLIQKHSTDCVVGLLYTISLESVSPVDDNFHVLLYFQRAHHLLDYRQEKMEVLRSSRVKDSVELSSFKAETSITRYSYVSAPNKFFSSTL